jgi:hypothetical protein
MAPNGIAPRFDGEDRYFVTAQLQETDPEKYYELVPGVVGRRLIPKIGAVNPNLPTYRWIATKLKGSTKVTRGRAKDQPTASVVREEKVHSVHTFEETFGWTIDEIRAARSVPGADLDRDNYVAALTKIEQSIDEALALGISSTNTTGLMNNSDVDHTDAGSKTGGGTSWLGSGALASEIILDVRKVIREALLGLKQAQIPGSNAMPMFQQFSLYLPLEHYNLIDMMPFGLGSDVFVGTVLEFLRKFSALKAIEPWWRLDSADDGDPMAVLVPALDDGKMNPMAGGGLLPLDYEQLPEQYHGRNVTIPVAGKCGGVAIRYPVAFRYLKIL